MALSVLACAQGARAETTDGRTTRVFPESRPHAGATVHAVSGDGRWLAFSSNERDPVGNLAANNVDIFVADLKTGTRHRVTPSGLALSFAGMSDDGTIVALNSSIDIAVAGDSNGQRDGFLWHRKKDTLTLATVSTSGAQGDFFSEIVGLSADGTMVLVRSAATNFAPGAGTRTSLFVRDVERGTTTLVNVLPDGTPGLESPEAQALSADGTKVLFATNAEPFVAGDPLHGAFVRDMTTGTTVRASVRVDGSADPDTHLLAIDGDGSHVAWSFAGAVKVRDMATGTTKQVTPGGTFLTHNIGMSASGRFLTWRTSAPEAVVFDLATGVARTVSVTDGGQALKASVPPSLVADGSRAYFSAQWPPTGGISEVFVHEIGVPPASTCANGGARQGAVSGPVYDAADVLGITGTDEPVCSLVVPAGL